MAGGALPLDDEDEGWEGSGEGELRMVEVDATGSGAGAVLCSASMEDVGTGMKYSRRREVVRRWGERREQSP